MKREEYISDEAVVKRVDASIKIELEKKKVLGIPAVIYDRDTQKIYYLNSDGTRVEASEKLRKGRYSERIRQKA